MTDNDFKGTLLLLQNRTRRDPESYREEFLSQFDHFKAASTNLSSQRTPSLQFIAVLNYVVHCCHCYPAEATAVGQIVLQLLRASIGNTLPAELRTTLVKALILLRSKNVVSIDDTFPMFFKLLQERDKPIRKLILAHIVSDVRRVNLPGAKGGAQTNRRAQNFLFSVMKEDDAVQARCAEMVMIDLYRRRVWADERTVEVLTGACFSKHTPILRTALRFFLLQMPKVSSNHESDSDEDLPDPGRAISKLKQKLKVSKKTAKRERILNRNVRQVKKRYNKEETEEQFLAKQHVDPIRLLRDPQSFVERLFAKLQRTAERFEVRILYLNVIARVISEYNVICLPLYAFLERYAEPSQLHSTKLLALSAMCVHSLVPPDALEPLVKAVANHFVTDRSSPDAITVGINTIREICKRQPLAMTEDLLKDLAEYRAQRGDRGVMMAARALIQLYREVYPDLLPAKLRSNTKMEETEKPVYGKQKVYTDIPGLELLYGNDSDASSDGDDDDHHASDGSGGSHDGAASDMSGLEGYSLASDDDDEEDEDDDEEDEDAWLLRDDEEEDDDECPQLIPITKKRGRSPEQEAAPRATKRQKPEQESDSTSAEEEEEEEDESLKSNSDDEEIDMSDLEELEELEEASGSDAEEDDEEDEEAIDSDDAGESVDDDDLEEMENSGGEEDEESDDEEEAEEEDEEDEEDKEVEEQPDNVAGGAPSFAEALAKHAVSAGKDQLGWFEDLDESLEPSQLSGRVAKRSSKASSVDNSSTVSSKASSMAAERIMTDEDFQRIRLLQAQGGSHLSLRGKKKEREARESKRYKLLHDVSKLSAEDLESFTAKKRESDKREKIDQAREARKANSKFELRKKTKSKLNSTHGEHGKRGKLFQMTKRSSRVAAKLRSSVSERANRKKEMKKKDIKFRIKRGWKA